MWPGSLSNSLGHLRKYLHPWCAGVLSSAQLTSRPWQSQETEMTPSLRWQRRGQDAPPGAGLMMHRWLASETVAGASSKSNSYHGEPYIPADVFSVSCHLCRLQTAAGPCVVWSSCDTGPGYFTDRANQHRRCEHLIDIISRFRRINLWKSVY